MLSTTSTEPTGLSRLLSLPTELKAPGCRYLPDNPAEDNAWERRRRTYAIRRLLGKFATQSPEIAPVEDRIIAALREDRGLALACIKDLSARRDRIRAIGPTRQAARRSVEQSLHRIYKLFPTPKREPGTLVESPDCEL